MTFTQLIIYGLATWRIASVFVNEPGPFFLFRKLRELAGIRHDERGMMTVIPDSFFAQILSCIWCSSLWIGLFFAVFAYISPLMSLQFAMIFAFSTIAILIEKFIRKI